MILGMLRVKNEARWIERCLRSLEAVCDLTLVLDDHSTDATRDICAAFDRVRVIESPFEGLDECRDKNFLLNRARPVNPDWIVAIDGDEVLSPRAMEVLPQLLLTTPARCVSLRIRYLWDREDQFRSDGVYGDFHRESVFRPDASVFRSRGTGPNFHCGNVPESIRRDRQVVALDILHFGYLHQADRIRKYEWYNHQDPGNAVEDRYRHMVIGDIFPAGSKFVHGGPLRLEPLAC